MYVSRHITNVSHHITGVSHHVTDVSHSIMSVSLLTAHHITSYHVISRTYHIVSCTYHVRITSHHDRITSYHVHITPYHARITARAFRMYHDHIMSYHDMFRFCTVSDAYHNVSTCIGMGTCVSQMRSHISERIITYHNISQYGRYHRTYRTRIDIYHTYHDSFVYRGVSRWVGVRTVYRVVCIT